MPVFPTISLRVTFVKIELNPPILDTFVVPPDYEEVMNKVDDTEGKEDATLQLVIADDAAGVKDDGGGDRDASATSVLKVTTLASPHDVAVQTAEALVAAVKADPKMVLCIATGSSPTEAYTLAFGIVLVFGTGVHGVHGITTL
jgi:hypothetical protein